MSDNAHWTVADETALLNFLFDHKAAGGDGVNFKSPTFTAAAVVVDASRTKGEPKTAKVCQNKWNSVRTFFS